MVRCKIVPRLTVHPKFNIEILRVENLVEHLRQKHISLSYYHRPSKVFFCRGKHVPK